MDSFSADLLFLPIDRLYEYWGNEWEEANACSDVDDFFLTNFQES